MALRSAGRSVRCAGSNGVAQHLESLDPAFQPVAGLHGTDTGGRAGENEIAALSSNSVDTSAMMCGTFHNILLTSDSWRSSPLTLRQMRPRDPSPSATG